MAGRGEVLVAMVGGCVGGEPVLGGRPAGACVRAWQRLGLPAGCVAHMGWKNALLRAEGVGHCGVPPSSALCVAAPVSHTYLWAMPPFAPALTRRTTPPLPAATLRGTSTSRRRTATLPRLATCAAGALTPPATTTTTEAPRTTGTSWRRRTRTAAAAPTARARAGRTASPTSARPPHTTPKVSQPPRRCAGPSCEPAWAMPCRVVHIAAAAQPLPCWAIQPLQSAPCTMYPPPPRAYAPAWPCM